MPTRSSTGLSKAPHVKLGRQYVGRFNVRHRRTGTLWEGRYKSCLVDSRGYLLRCYRYIDLNPVRARQADDPVAFPWSSCAARCGTDDPLISHHHAYLDPGASIVERADAYRAILREALFDDALQEIRTYLQQQRALGRDDFRAMAGPRRDASPASVPPTGRDATPEANK